MMRKFVIGLSLATVSSLASAVAVFGETDGLTTIGTFAAGTYQITGSGIVSLAGIAGDGVFDMLPTGIPKTPVTLTGYGYFNPNGSTIADGNSGVVGAGALFGALYGTFNVNPTSPADYFLIGSSALQTLNTTQTLYARVNDMSGSFSNNSGFYEVTVAAIPEPHEWAMMLAGLGLVGLVARRRRDVEGTAPAAIA
jgi:hypothetical protein